MLRMQQYVSDRPVFNDETLVEHGHLIADRADNIHLVRDENDRQAEAAVDVAQQAEDGLRRLRIERRRRFVAEQQLRMIGERPRDTDALLLSAGELRGVFVAMLGQFDEFEQLADPRVHFGVGVFASQLEREANVVANRLGADQVEVLENHPRLAAVGLKLGFRQLRDIAAVNQNATAVRSFQEIQRANQRALAGTRGADDAEDLALLDAQVDVGNGRYVTSVHDVVLGDVFNVDHRGFRLVFLGDDTPERVDSWVDRTMVPR